ncbi:MAG: ABC transporter substrate-binding protein [Polyangiaceae bacterium]|nr:ABC transporter substrate-binding protein [Polyangiaceae bacterium]MCW5792427.1 ABC transporter substrate-binding protein [Polyangiaceae bacterium]
MRLVSLTCSNTEIVHSLQLSQCLVGVDDHSDYPKDILAKLPRVGPDLGIDVARVAALEPDVVLASLTVPGHEQVVERLTQAGLPLLVTEPVSVADVCDDVIQIAERLARFPGGEPALERAQAVVAELRAALRSVLPSSGPLCEASPSSGPPRILVEWWPRPVIVPGKDSWVNQQLAAAGAINPMGDRAVKSSPIELQEATLMQPDAVVIAWCGVHLTKYRPSVVYERTEWAELPALKARRVYRVPEAFLGRPSPRLISGVQAFRSIVSDIEAGRPAPEDAIPIGLDVSEV